MGSMERVVDSSVWLEESAAKSPFNFFPNSSRYSSCSKVLRRSFAISSLSSILSNSSVRLKTGSSTSSELAFNPSCNDEILFSKAVFCAITSLIKELVSSLFRAIPSFEFNSSFCLASSPIAHRKEDDLEFSM